VDPRLAGNFERYFASNRHPVVWFGEPSEMDRRLVAQSGLLVMPGIVEAPLDELLQGYDSGEPLLEKMVLPRTRSWPGNIQTLGAIGPRSPRLYS
jgi:hypothetical protein